jgi:hypothetical protein
VFAMVSSGSVFLFSFSAIVSGALNDHSASSIFTFPGISIPEAPAANVVELITHPDPLAIHPRAGGLLRWGGENRLGKRQSASEVVNTIFDGVYPVINVTWGNKDGKSSQSFISFIDTGQLRQIPNINFA